ncbi:LicD family protein [uncultured Tateyamaria sp.]|uniref:LicD family protein n=1 Tax=uncultured Tateyamaria sp. TaxID=455651 RepID=UPI0026078AD2|nr:LicD family protein [uncultured Tateyamaria sp.]
MAPNTPSVRSAHDRVKEIHSIALAEVLTRSGAFDVWRYFGELNDLKQRPVSTTWREAFVMVCCVGQIRAAKVVGNLKRLRNMLPPEEFAEFDTRMRDYLAPIALTNHGFREGNFATVDPAPIWSHVKGLTQQLESEGLRVFLNSGTLLGVVRDQSLIAHDDDIDLAVILDADSAVSAAAAWRRLSERLREIGLSDASTQKAPEIHKLTPIGTFEVDLFPVWIEAGRVFVYPHTFGDLTYDDLLPLGVCNMTGCAIPRAPEKMLAVNYGEDWRDPDPLFTFKWTKANEKFVDFMQALRG